MCETEITRINGNGLPYTTGLPTIIILDGTKYNEVAQAHIKENTGLDFKPDSWGNLAATPENAAQIVALFMTYNFKTRYYNNGQTTNTIYLKSDHHVGFDVDSICFDCVQENRIQTNGLKPGDRLAC